MTDEEKRIKRRTRPGVRQVYWRNCTTCNFMRKHADFRLRVMQSTYFNPEGTESLAGVVHDYGDPMRVTSVYMHFKRHQPNDLARAREKYKHAFTTPAGEIVKTDVLLPAGTSAMLEGSVVTDGEHEVTLNEFIAEGRKKMLSGKMAITATNLLAAIKIRADIEKSTKDRRLDMIKSFFAGGAKKEDQGE